MSDAEKVKQLQAQIAELQRQIAQLNTENLRLMARLDIAQTGRRRP